MCEEIAAIVCILGGLSVYLGNNFPLCDNRAASCTLVGFILDTQDCPGIFTLERGTDPLTHRCVQRCGAFHKSDIMLDCLIPKASSVSCMMQRLSLVIANQRCYKLKNFHPPAGCHSVSVQARAAPSSRQAERASSSGASLQITLSQARSAPSSLQRDSQLRIHSPSPQP